MSYKYVECRYSDPEAKLALHNLFIFLLKEEGDSGELSGDGTGYSVWVDSHYRSDPRKYGKKYVHFFSLIDHLLGCMLAVGFYTNQKWMLSKPSLCCAVLEQL
ncbi:MAG: hypothetical protein GX799_11415 [Crenarchaeota archaeon]|nr:hypothetical protein [Thermoproteota archaeon]